MLYNIMKVLACGFLILCYYGGFLGAILAGMYFLDKMENKNDKESISSFPEMV